MNVTFKMINAETKDTQYRNQKKNNIKNRNETENSCCRQKI